MSTCPGRFTLHPFTQIPVVLLAGGLGTRLRSVTGKLPKVLAPISGRPFLELLLNDLRKNGYSRVILSLGYGADAVLSYLSSAGWQEPFVSWVREPEPLGTGGGLLHTLQEKKIDGPVVVSNADTWIECAWSQLAQHSPGSGSIGVISVGDIGRFGEVRLDSSKTRALQFLEKTQQPKPGLIYSGIAVLSRNDLGGQASPVFSLEKDVFPKLAAEGKLKAFSLQGQFTDIGSPADYQAFVQSFEKQD